MPKNAEALAHLLSRRSIPAVRLTEPAPGADDLDAMLTAAIRVPDHGKLAPWRFILVEGEERRRFTDALIAIWRAGNPDASAEAEAIERGKRTGAPTVVIVISRAAEHPKIPVWEQELSAGAACMNLVHAAHASGYAAQWLTGWPAYDEAVARLLGLSEGERVAGFISVGTPSEAPVERDRPEPEALVSRWKG